jgi:hypothetical protein
MNSPTGGKPHPERDASSTQPMTVENELLGGVEFEDGFEITQGDHGQPQIETIE